MMAGVARARQCQPGLHLLPVTFLLQDLLGVDQSVPEQQHNIPGPGQVIINLVFVIDINYSRHQ